MRRAALFILFFPGFGCSDGDKQPSDSALDPGGSGDDSGTTDGGTTDGGTTDGGTTGCDTARAPAEPFAVAPSDPGLRYVGRWSFEDPEAPAVWWQGGSVALNLDGTALSVTLDAGSRTEYLRVIIDGDHAGSLRHELAPGIGTYAVAEGLAPGAHSVSLVKETYAGDALVIRGFDAVGWGLLDPPEPPGRHIEFYGDSNLAGSSLMSEKNQGGWDLVGCHFSYAGVTARAFGADYHNISTSGDTLTSMASRYDRVDRSAATPTWDSAAAPADVVVMNLGANDIYGASEETIRQRYVDLLDLLRAAHPDAHIVVYNGWGWDFDEPADYTGQVVADYGDAKVSAASFPWVFEQWHGCETDHGGMAMVLIDHLESVMGWTAGEPDLMSGFGRGGDLANGGFESIAPFGGYGWRYYTDGVERVVDAAQAHQGEAFLRLAEGSEVHQPNPASGGQAVTVSLWLRGASDGDTAEVTVDFRDQEMWTTPLQTETTTVALTTEWAQHTVAATAPVIPPRPVFHTRLTVASGSGTVEVDGLEMRTE